MTLALVVDLLVVTVVVEVVTEAEVNYISNFWHDEICCVAEMMSQCLQIYTNMLSNSINSFNPYSVPLLMMLVKSIMVQIAGTNNIDQD